MAERQEPDGGVGGEDGDGDGWREGERGRRDHGQAEGNEPGASAAVGVAADHGPEQEAHAVGEHGKADLGFRELCRVTR